jgi:hypothetical protein
VDRFWKKVNKLPGDNSCWLWIAGKDKYGYGQFKLDGKNVRAHQVSWKIQKGEWPSYLCHTCDNPSCVNPLHLYIGNNQTNTNDKMLRGRHKCNHNFTDDQVILLRQLYELGFSSTRIQKALNIPKRTIIALLNGQTYPNTGGPIRDRGSRYWSNRYSTGKTGV